MLLVLPLPGVGPRVWSEVATASHQVPDRSDRSRSPPRPVAPAAEPEPEPEPSPEAGEPEEAPQPSSPSSLATTVEQWPWHHDLPSDFDEC